jgi:hypothetical protein
LIDRKYPTDKRFDANSKKTQWQRFEAWVKHLNSGCQKRGSVQYKVLIFGRHGEGWHNAAESFYGTPAWNVSVVNPTASSSSRLNTTNVRSATGLNRRAMARPSGPIRY